MQTLGLAYKTLLGLLPAHLPHSAIVMIPLHASVIQLLTSASAHTLSSLVGLDSYLQFRP